ncbi:MAG: glyoxylate/hydroxypyruvate reductase A [Alphaproteobacteria bacterium]|nr:MAG: glyoxylate/hydroxypyruvate reductase A [Alphaproteobacteria bacterium]
MSKGALALLISGGTENWAPLRWRVRFLRVCPGRPVALIPVDAVDAASVRYAAVWKPKPGALSDFPNLEVIFNLGAGVDAVISDLTLPPVPLVRVAVGDLTGRMTEYVVMHVLMHHRRQGYYAESQRAKVWAPKLQWAASDLRVGIMGLGVLGRDCAEVLARIGFDVAGWSGTWKSIPGIKCFAGEGQLGDFLARTDVLVCLLPLTAQTRGILSRRTFAKLARDGKLGGPVIINAGRGGLQVEDDILSALDDGTLLAATLDVFATEPLPPDSPFWSHPRVTLSPHNAADTDPDAISLYVAEQIARHERGEPLQNVVDRAAGY